MHDDPLRGPLSLVSEDLICAVEKEIRKNRASAKSFSWVTALMMSIRLI